MGRDDQTDENAPARHASTRPADLRRLGRSDLRQVADELRAETIDAVSVTGGHLGAGLGVVELTVALHYVFDTPHDRLIWDVGHQAYPHKILTGRRDRIRTLRQGGGLSGFTKRAESEYDPFGAAHSSTSISAGLGMAVARDLDRRDNNVVAVIGDGAMSAGMAYEAMNNAGAHAFAADRHPQRQRHVDRAAGRRDVGLSRAPRLGRHLPARCARSAKQLAEPPAQVRLRQGRSAPRNTPAASGPAARCSRSSASTMSGPIDGHNLDHLLPVLKNVRDAADGPDPGPCRDPEGQGLRAGRGVRRQVSRRRRRSTSSPARRPSPRPNAPTYTRVFGESLVKEARRDDKIVAITAAMPSGTGLDLFGKAFPTRTFDVGIAEQHAVTFAAGLATEGYKPFCAIYSTFLQRAYDQVVHDVAIQNLPVRFAHRPRGPRRRGRRRPMPARSTSPISAACRTWSSWRPPTRPSWCTWSRPPRP